MSRRPAGQARTPLTPERQALAARYLGLAMGTARPYMARWPYLADEFESAAQLALVEAAEAFEPGRGVKFPTFARPRLWGAMRDVQRRQVAYGWRGDVAIAPRVGRLTFDAEARGRVLCCEPDGPVGWAAESIESVERWLRKLPPRHAAALRLIYLRGMTHVEAARAIGCSPSRIAYIHQEAMGMLNGKWAVRVRATG